MSHPSQRLLSLERLLALVLALALAAAACGNDDDAETPSASPGEEGTAAESLEGLEPGAPLDVGALLTLSGAQAVIGEIQLRGIEIAVDELNAEGGVAGHPIRLVVRDTGADPTTAVSLAQELVEREGVKFILGTTLSTPALAVFEYLNEAEVPMMGSQSADAVANPEQYPFGFSMSPLTSIQAATVVELSLEAFDPAVVGILAEATAFGDSFKVGFDEVLAEHDVTDVVTQQYEQGAADVEPQLSTLRDAGAEVVFAAALGSDIVRIVRTASLMGWDVPIVAPSGSLAETVEAAGGATAVENLYAFMSRKHTYPEGGEPDPAAQAFADKLKEKLGQDPLETNLGQDSAFYDVVHLMKFSFEEAATVEGAAVRDALASMEWDEGSYAEWRMNPDTHTSITVEDQALVQAGTFRDGFFQRLAD